MMAICYLLDVLPPELVSSVLQHVPLPDLIRFSATSKLAYEYATDLTWRDVVLRDRFHHFPLSVDEVNQLSIQTSSNAALATYDLSIDHHDDTPIVQKLIILIKKPALAAKVRTVTHLCHLPGPDIFDELMTASFSSQSLSSDWRTIELLRLAIRNMVNVHTIRLYFPHYNLGRVLLNDFFEKSRPRNIPIRRLWLENCDIFCDNLYSTSFDLTGLQSIRARRLKSFYFPIGSFENASHFSLSRDGSYRSKLDGAGGSMLTWHHTPNDEHLTRPHLDGHSAIFKAVPSRKVSPCSSPGSVIFNRHMYENIPEADMILESRKGLLNSLPPLNVNTRSMQDTGDSYSNVLFTYESNDMHLIRMLSLPWENLRHLNLDWILVPVMYSHHLLFQRQYRFLAQLSALRFRNLTSFQFRNAISSECQIPSNISLLHPLDMQVDQVISQGPSVSPETVRIDFLEFLEHHPNITCLAWPIDQFYPRYVDSQYIKRIRDVVDNLGSTLQTLRIDTKLNIRGERQSEPILFGTRRHFILDFACHMRSIKTIKMEGGIARDEKREILRALHKCPVERIIMIGRSFPLGNTWDSHAAVIAEVEGDMFTAFSDYFEPENHAVIEAATQLKPQQPISNSTFYPTYGWNGQPMLLSIASLFAPTITELKFCGYNGSPIVRRPVTSKLDITPGILHHLRYFHNLEQLVLLVYLPRSRDVSRADMINNWRNNGKRIWTVNDLQHYAAKLAHERNQRETVGNDNNYMDSSSTAFPVFQDILESYEGPALAISLWEMISPHLSPIALQKGMKFRAGFCIGEDHNEDIFDLDISLNENGVASVRGPHSLWDGGRWWTKITERSYF